MPSLKPETTDVVVLCGGRGTRLGSLTTNTPKPLLLVRGEPFLLRRLRALRTEGVTRVLLAVHYLAPQFHAFVRQYAKELPMLQVIEEPVPLGTGGALRHAVAHVRSSVFIAMNGDSWGMKMAPVLEAHAARRARFTMVIVRAEHIEGNARHKGVVLLGPDGALQGLSTGDAVGSQWVNAGVYALDRELVAGWPESSYNLESCLSSLVAPGDGWTFASEGPFLDIGTPDCFKLANQQGLE